LYISCLWCVYVLLHVWTYYHIIKISLLCGCF
jgi:hypothetical protein